MEHTIYLEFDRNNIPYDVYDVKLASENPSDDWGIVDLTTDTAVVSSGEEIISSPVGTYSYTFDVENGHSYFASWEIIANAGESPTYKTDQFGPFFSVNNDNIRAVSSYYGNFITGVFTTLMLKITLFDGSPINAEDISISIYKYDGSSVSLNSVIPVNVDTGFYIYEWNISSDQEPGEYTVVWSYVADDIEKAEVQNIVVSEDATQSSVNSMYWGRPLEFKLALEHHLACAQSIPIYYEQSKSSRDNQIFKFTFPRWNQSAGVRIYKNQNIVNSGAEVNYFTGEVKFDSTLSEHETVNADYNFKWFTDDDLYRFLINALQTVNAYPPHDSYTLYSIPDRYTPIVLYGAAKDALRQLMMCLQFQEPAQIFGDADASQRVFQNLETLKENYEKDWEKLLEQKKYGPYPRTRMIVTPEYTLPGGRSRWFRYLFKG